MAIDGGTDGPIGGGPGEPDGGGEGGPGEPATVSPDQPSVREDQLWQSRAEEAESRVEDLEGRLIELQADLEAAAEIHQATERRGEMERLLRESNAVDVETAMLLTEMAVMGMDEPDVELAVDELKRGKPFLFRGPRRGSGAGGSAMSASPASSSERVNLGSLADEAKSSGDRAALLRYLRGRRVV